MRGGSSQDKLTVMKLTSIMVHKHYCENDVESVIAQLDDEILWIGTGENEYAVGTENVTRIFREFSGKIPKCNITDEHYDVLQIASDVFLCNGRMWISTDPSTGISLRVHQRISTAFRWTGKRFCCCLIHISNPYDDMADGKVGFPTKIAYQSYLYLQEQVENQRKKLEKQTEALRRMSYEDTLTGLYNRNKFNQMIDEEPGQQIRHLGIVYLDLNGLKEINDKMGHSAGDTLLRQMADCIRNHFAGKAYRIGGDEFVVIDEMLEEDEFRMAVQAAEEEMTKAGISYSAGISWRSSACSIREQFEEADKLMYQAKRSFYRMGKNDRRKSDIL